MVAAMSRWLFVLTLLLPAAPALADATADARALSEAFARAAESGDVAAVVALYADDARAVYPPAGAEAHGKAEIEKLVARTFAGGKMGKLRLVSLDAIALDADHIATVGRWEQVIPGPGGKARVVPVRTTEVLVKQNGAWRYLVDHASVGAAPPPPASRRGPRRER
jgi:uncharacterized protein (TIGR02246 family)